MIRICNLNVLVKKQGHDFTSRLNFASAHSYVGNRDADGIFCSSDMTLVKSSHKLDYSRYRNKIKESKFVISHQRLATHGLNEENHQPLQQGRFVLVHNGVLFYPDLERSGKKSDSRKFLEVFVSNFDETKNIQESIRRSIKASSGSFSIFLYDLKYETGYYFKNYSTSIHVFRLKGGDIFISTCFDNRIFFPVKREIAIKNYTIYTFRVLENKVKMKSRGEIMSTTQAPLKDFCSQSFGTSKYLIDKAKEEFGVVDEKEEEYDANDDEKIDYAG